MSSKRELKRENQLLRSFIGALIDIQSGANNFRNNGATTENTKIIDASAFFDFLRNAQPKKENHINNEAINHVDDKIVEEKNIKAEETHIH
jgi:hypothetical protein